MFSTSSKDLSSRIYSACAAVSALFPGQVLMPGTSGFREAQDTYWNAQQRDRIPACFFQPEDVSQVQRAIVEVVKVGCPFAIRSGGHSSNLTGSSAAGGFLFDLGRLNHVEIAKDRQTVRLGPGNRWGETLKVLENQGLTAVGGRDFGVGVGGFIFGGGISYHASEHGWGIDNLVAVDVVLANGELVTATESSHPDLFRALHGGGAHNFGIATNLTLRLFPYQGMWGGMNVVAEESIDDVFAAYDTYTSDMIHDKKAHIILNFFTVDGKLCNIQFMGYTSPDVGSNGPEIFDNFRAIPKVQPDTLRVTDYSDLTSEMARETDCRGHRNAYRTLCFDYDPALLRAIYQIWRDTLSVTSDKIRIAFDVNHIAPSMRAGRNNLYGPSLGRGPTPLDKPLTNILLTAVWDDPASDAIIATVLRRMCLEMEALTKAKGKARTFKYMNYSHAEQDVIGGLGEETRMFLQDVSRKYDPVSAFQVLQQGCFKINTSKTTKDNVRGNL